MAHHVYRATMDLVCKDQKKVIDRAIELELERRKDIPTVAGGAIYHGGAAFLDDGQTLVPADQLRDHFTKNFDDAVAEVWYRLMDEAFFEQFDCEWKSYNVEELAEAA